MVEPEQLSLEEDDNNCLDDGDKRRRAVSKCPKVTILFEADVLSSKICGQVRTYGMDVSTKLLILDVRYIVTKESGFVVTVFIQKAMQPLNIIVNRILIIKNLVLNQILVLIYVDWVVVYTTFL